MRIFCISLAICLGTMIAGQASAQQAGPRPIEDVKVITPTGQYAVVTLRFDMPKAPESLRRWQYVGGLRDGRLTIAHDHRLREPCGELTLESGKLTGTFTRTEGRRGSFALGKVTVDATVTDGEIKGTATIDGHEGSVTGTIVPETEMAKQNAVPDDKSWPMFLGPPAGGVAAESTGVEIVDSFHKARLRWRSEATDVGQGLGGISRKMQTWRDANTIRTCSGASSPVAADGRVFLSYYVPSPARGMDEKKAAAMAKEAGVDSPEKLPLRDKEKLFQAADDTVLAVDAATGKMLWKAVMAGRGINHQHHKEGPFNISPAVAEGRVFAIGMSGWLYAFDAKTGKPLWEVRLAGAGRSKHWSATVVALPGVVVAPQGKTWCGFDPATGKRLWKSSLPFAHATLAVWRHKGTDYLVSGTGGSLVWSPKPEDLVCLNAKTGEQVWKADLAGDLSALNSRGRGLGPGGITTYGDYMVLQLAETDAKAKGRSGRRDAMEHSVAGFRLTLEGPKRLWKIPMTGREGSHTKPIVHGKYLFTGGLEVVDLETGKIVSQTKGVQPGNGGYMQAVEDVVYVRRDGTHSNIEFATYRVSPEGQVTVMDSERMWVPPVGGHTTSYHHPITYPLINGRMYVRQRDGVYCWDLRAKAAQ